MSEIEEKLMERKSEILTFWTECQSWPIKRNRMSPPPHEENEKDHSEEPESNEGSPEEKELLELQEEINQLMSKQK